MAIDQLHGLHAVALGSAVKLAGITNQSVNLGVAVIGAPNTNNPYVRYQGIRGVKASASFSTIQIGTFIDACGLFGKDIGDLTGDTVTLYAEKFEAGGTRASSGHNSYTMNAGMVVPLGISASGQQDATLNATVVPIYDGSNAPVIKAESATLLTGLTDAEYFALGPVTVGAKSLGAVKSVEINFGVNVITEFEGSELYDRYVAIASITPSITISGVDLNWLKSDVVPALGLAGTHANTSIYLRKRASGSTFVADETEEHIKFTAYGFAVANACMNATTNERGECTITMPLAYDGANAPLVADTTSAIT